jgi:methionyl aminopeptidase
MINVKSPRELDLMRQSGRLVAEILQEVAKKAQPGVSLAELDQLAESLTLERGAKPAFKGYMGYRHTLCTSVNEQIVHGIPTSRVLQEGDIVGLDYGLVLNGFFGDSAVTVPIGKVSSSSALLLLATRDALYAAIAASTEGNTIRDIAAAVESVVKPLGYGIVREFVGHGIGQKLHETPQIPNYSEGASNLRLRSGMTICIEPMITEGSPGVAVLPDKWTAVTRDGKLSAHFEHTIAITKDKAEVLTEWIQPKFAEALAGVS